ncbi:nudix hydrolase 11-like [Syzygium oleosum]|uniref:nudix hydrolase 11-like n=1 Tax=Syzygium oleosum TaxID=219896 RepID=UPI0024BAACB7|nr:nudix hydrolase 11-like [Syzygium oleosum]
MDGPKKGMASCPRSSCRPITPRGTTVTRDTSSYLYNALAHCPTNPPTEAMTTPPPSETSLLTLPDSHGLAALARRLRRYEPPPPSGQTDQQQHEKPDGSETGAGRRSETTTESPRRRPNRARAAVLICLFQDGSAGGGSGDGGDLRVLLTKRASTLSAHPGEVSLPGGKREDGDADDVATALREAKEEIGLDPSLVEVVTVLQPFVTKIGITVVPVVGILADKNAYCPATNPAEVEVIFDAPLEMFLQDENRRAEEREWMGDKYLLHRFDYQTADKKYEIFALTAGILIRTASVVYQRPPAFAELCLKFWHS